MYVNVYFNKHWRITTLLCIDINTSVNSREINIRSISPCEKQIIIFFQYVLNQKNKLMTCVKIIPEKWSLEKWSPKNCPREKWSLEKWSTEKWSRKTHKQKIVGWASSIVVCVWNVGMWSIYENPKLDN